MTPGALATICRGDVVALTDGTRRVVATDGLICGDLWLVGRGGSDTIRSHEVARRIPRSHDHGPHSTGPFTADVDR